MDAEQWLDNEPMEIAGLILRPTSPVDMGANPLSDKLDTLRDLSEDYELFEIHIPGERRRAYLLHRPYLGRTQICWGQDMVVSGYYPLSEACSMFRERIAHRQEIEEMEDNKTMRPATQRTTVTNPPPLRKGATNGKRSGKSRQESPQNVSPPKRRGGRPKGSKNKPKATETYLSANILETRLVDELGTQEYIESRRRALLQKQQTMRKNDRLSPEEEHELAVLQQMAAQKRGVKIVSVLHEPKEQVIEVPACRQTAHQPAAQPVAQNTGGNTVETMKRRGRVPRTYGLDEALEVANVDADTLQWLVEQGHVRMYGEDALYASDIDKADRWLDRTPLEEGQEEAEEEATVEGAAVPTIAPIPEGIVIERETVPESDAEVSQMLYAVMETLDGGEDQDYLFETVLGLKDWWKKRQEEGRLHKERIKAQALGKLTPEERAVLGL